MFELCLKKLPGIFNSKRYFAVDGGVSSIAVFFPCFARDEKSYLFFVLKHISWVVGEGGDKCTDGYIRVRM